MKLKVIMSAFLLLGLTSCGETLNKRSSSENESQESGGKVHNANLTSGDDENQSGSSSEICIETIIKGIKKIFCRIEPRPVGAKSMNNEIYILPYTPVYPAPTDGSVEKLDEFMDQVKESQHK